MNFDERELIRLRRVTDVAPSPCGTWLAVAAQRLDEEHQSKYVSDIWRVDLATRSARRLTRGGYDDRAPAFRHDGALAFLSDRPAESNKDDATSKHSQVWSFPVDGGDPVMLTDEPLGVMSFRCAKERDLVAVVANVLVGVALDEMRECVRDRNEHGPSSLEYDAMPVRFWDHWLPDEAPHLIVYRDKERCDLTPEASREYRQAQWDLSRDGTRLVVTRAQLGSDRIAESALEIFDTTSGASQIAASRPRTWFHSPVFSPDGRHLAHLRHERQDKSYGKSQLALLDVETGESRDLAPDFDGWLAPSDFTSDGTGIVCTASWQGQVPIFRVEVDTGEVVRLSAEAAGGSHTGVVRIDDESERIVGVRSRVDHPPEPFVLENGPDAHPDLPVCISGFEGADFVQIERVTVESTDGACVPTTIVRPREAAGELPALLWIHGGPIAAWHDEWHWRWNPLIGAARGYLMVLPNPRGSTGFGQDFVEGIWGNVWGAQCYEDLMAVTDQVAQREDVDASRMVAMGGSFGGYMTNWIGGQTDRFTCLVSHAGLTDLAAFYGVTDNPPWWGHMFGATPLDDRTALDLYSPIRHVANWSSPVLVIHGQRDYRVPVGEALLLFEALQHHGVDSRLLIFPDENHWILKPRNIEAWYERVFAFIDAHAGDPA